MATDDRPITPSPLLGRTISSFFDWRDFRSTYRPHGAGTWLAMYTVGGVGEFRQPGGFRLLMQAGDLVCVEPDAWSEYSSDETVGWQLHWVHFQPLPGWEEWLEVGRIGRGLHRVHLAATADRERLTAAFVRLHADLVGGGRHGEDLALSALAEILLLAARADARDRSPDSRVRAALEHMQGDPSHPHTVESLAAVAGLSPSRFAHLFRDATGETPLAALTRLRLGLAKRLLAHTDEPIGRIALDSGFGSSTYFARLFRRATGCTPQAWRNGQFGPGEWRVRD